MKTKCKIQNVHERYRSMVSLTVQYVKETGKTCRFLVLSFEKTENSRGDYDYWVVKLNSSGNIQWDKTMGGSNDDVLTSLQQASDGGYILGGRSYSNKSGEKTENKKGSNDYWVVKLNNQGKIQWDKTVGGNKDDSECSIKEKEKDRYILVGASISGISGDKKRRSRGSGDYWLVGLDARGNTTITTSQNMQSVVTPKIINNKEFSIYPNPAKDALHIQTNGKATLSLTNESGQLLLTKIITAKGEINISALSVGVYFLKCNETGAVQKIIVNK